MGKIILEKSSLNGEVSLSGSKTGAMALSILSILTDDDCILENFPINMGDVSSTISMIESLGKRIDVNGNIVKIKKNLSIKSHLKYSIKQINFTPLILAALLLRKGSCSVPLPGGCKIGNRKIDIYEYIFLKFGATFVQNENNIHSEIKKKLVPSKLFLPLETTGGTICALILASGADGESHIINPHLRPEIIEVIHVLNKMGAEIKIRNGEIHIKGTSVFLGIKQKIMFDIMEAITFVILSGSTEGEVQINNFPYAHLVKPMKTLKYAGLNFDFKNNNLNVFDGGVKAMSITTGPFPEIQSDMQPLFASLAILADGKSKICDLRFKERYQYAIELQKLGVKSEFKNGYLQINGNKKNMVGANVIARDIRCGAALIVAGINANGKTTIDNIHQINRGYENIVHKLKILGCKISNG